MRLPHQADDMVDQGDTFVCHFPKTPLTPPGFKLLSLAYVYKLDNLHY